MTSEFFSQLSSFINEGEKSDYKADNEKNNTLPTRPKYK